MAFGARMSALRFRPRTMRVARDRDPLTGTLSRSGLLSKLRAASTQGSAVALLLVNIDDFRVVNQWLGPETGDRVLQEVAGRLKGGARHACDIARVGGDQFAVVATGALARGGAGSLTRQLLRELRRPFGLTQRGLQLSYSVGIASRREDAHWDGIELVHEAECAMHAARERGRGQVVTFADAAMDSVPRLRLLYELEYGIAKSEFAMHYQPVVDLESGRPVGVEALLRWEHPELGMVLPGEFVPLAESHGLMSRIGEWVIDRVFADVERWSMSAHPLPRGVSINISANQIGPLFAHRFLDRIEVARIDPQMLCIELTETALLRDLPGAAAALGQLVAGGVRCAIDDFGVGYGSMSYLGRLPIDVLKIDRCFIDPLGTDANNDAIVTSVLALSRSLGLEAIAEGVETEWQRVLLLREGCRYGQGYLFSPARPLEDVMPMFGAGRVLAPPPAET